MRGFSTKMGSYLPPGGGLGPMFDPNDPTTGKRGKSMKTQHMESPVGKRGAGRAQITSGDPGAHAMGHYGKKGPLGGMTGGDLF